MSFPRLMAALCILFLGSTALPQTLQQVSMEEPNATTPSTAEENSPTTVDGVVAEGTAAAEAAEFSRQLFVSLVSNQHLMLQPGLCDWVGGEGGLPRQKNALDEFGSPEALSLPLVSGTTFVPRYYEPDADGDVFYNAKWHDWYLKKSRFYLEGLEELRVKAICPSADDLCLGTEAIVELARSTRIPFLSANLYHRKHGRPLFRTHIEYEAEESTSVLLVGLTGEPTGLYPENPEIDVRSPKDRLRALLDGLPKRSRFIVLLTTLSNEQIEDISREFPEVRLILGGREEAGKDHTPDYAHCLQDTSCRYVYPPMQSIALVRCEIGPPQAPIRDPYWRHRTKGVTEQKRRDSARHLKLAVQHRMEPFLRMNVESIMQGIVQASSRARPVGAALGAPEEGLLFGSTVVALWQEYELPKNKLHRRVRRWLVQLDEEPISRDDVSIRPDHEAKKAGHHLNLFQWNRAEPRLSAAITGEPKNAAWLAQRGTARAKLARWEEAEEDFDKAIEISTDGFVRVDYPSQWDLMWDLEAAGLQVYEELLKEAPNDDWRLLCHGYLAARCARWEDAMSDFATAVSEQTRLWPVWLAKASLHARRQEWTEVDAAASECIALESKCSEAWYWHGLAQLHAGFREHGIRSLGRSINLGYDEWPAWYYRGIAHLDLGRPTKAIADLTEAIRLGEEWAGLAQLMGCASTNEPPWYRVYMDRAQAHGLSGDWTSAALDYAEAARWLRTSDDTLADRAELLSLLARTQLCSLRQDRYAQLCSELVDRLTDDDDARRKHVGLPTIDLAVRTCCLAPQGVQAEHALRKLADQLVEEKPEEWGCQETLGGLLYRLGDYPEALARLNRASSLNPDELPVEHFLVSAMTHHKLQRTPEARRMLEEGVRRSAEILGSLPKMEQLLLRRLRCEAEDELGVLVGAETDTAARHLRRGSDRYELGEPDRALPDFTKALKADPDNPVAYLWRGCAHGANENWDQAIADCEESLRTDPGNTCALRNRGTARLCRGQYREAIGDFAALYEAAPEGDVLYLRALAHCGAENLSSAVADLRLAVAMQPTLLDAHRVLAWLSAMHPGLSDTPRATECADKALALSRSPACLRARSFAYERAGRIQDVERADKIRETVSSWVKDAWKVDVFKFKPTSDDLRVSGSKEFYPAGKNGPRVLVSMRPPAPGKP